MNIGNEDAQRLLRVHEELRTQQNHNDLLAVLSLPEGRRFVWDLLEHCGTFGPSFVAGDAGSTAFNEGRRSLGIGLMVRCQGEAADLYVKALHEQIVERHKEDQLRKAAEAEALKNQEENDNA